MHCIQLYIQIYGFQNIRTGILDYHQEGFPGPPGHFNIRNPICLHIHLNIRIELVFHTTSGASRSRPPSTYLNVVTVLLHDNIPLSYAFYYVLKAFI